MKRKNSRKVTITVGNQVSFPTRLARTKRESAANLELLFHLQALAYPQLNEGVRMKRGIVKIFKRR